MDPLSPLSSHPSSSSAVNKKVTPTAIISGQLNRTIGQQAKKDYLNWNLKKTAYLKKYTTDKNIPIISVCCCNVLLSVCCLSLFHFVVNTL